MAKNKKTLISEFNQMKELEEWASGFYLNIASDSRVQDKEAKEAFEKISGDETRHAQIVGKIINIINNNL